VRNTAEKELVERLEAVYISGCKGQLFCLSASGVRKNDVVDYSDLELSRPNAELTRQKLPPEVVNNHYVLFVPPFGEEVNLCRRFHSLIRAQLSQFGAISVIPDLFGSGDSAGLLEDADWETWVQDLKCVIRHFCLDSLEVGIARHKLSIIATRAGCLLAKDLLLSSHELDGWFTLQNIVFIQPERTGEDVINRLFRARILAQRLAGDRSENTQDLWDLVKSGQYVYAGGHRLSSSLCRSLRENTIDKAMLDTMGKVRTWFSLKSDTAGDADDLIGISGVGTVVPPWTMHSRRSLPFWQAYDVEPETALVDAVVSATLKQS